MAGQRQQSDHSRPTAGEETVSKIHELTFKNIEKCTQALVIEQGLIIQGRARQSFFEYV